MKNCFYDSPWDFLGSDEKICESYEAAKKNKRNIETTNPFLKAILLIEEDRLKKELAEGRYVSGPYYGYESYSEVSVDMSKNLPKPKHMMLNGDYTTVVWNDGTSTVVKRMKGEKDDPEKAILFAIMKKMFDGNKANLDKYLSEFEDKTIIKEKKDKKKRGK